MDNTYKVGSSGLNMGIPMLYHQGTLLYTSKIMLFISKRMMMWLNNCVEIFLKVMISATAMYFAYDAISLRKELTGDMDSQDRPDNSFLGNLFN